MNAVDELNFRLGIGPPRPRLPITLQRSGYSAVRQLGKGSFGNAYLVYHNERKDYYVVKHVNMANMTPRQRKDAHQEIAVLQQLEYPNIIRYVEFCEEYPNLYIVMEYADGGDVYTHLKNIKRSVWALGGGASGLTEEQVISLFVQTTMAVKYMHDRRLLHRDIKSQNVFLTQDHVVKLGDFGISTVLMSTVAMAQTMCGTPCYFSPELCEGKPYNNKSDVWALGVFLYELCTTGRLPFGAVTMNRLMDEICKKEPRRIPSSFSDELWDLILWMLKKDPRQRPDAGQILRSPVLVRAIPNLIKKLNATGSRCEKEYRRLLTMDESPLPPIRPVDLRQQQQQQQQQPNEGYGNKLTSAGAAAALSVAGAGRFDIFRRRNDEYPFKCMKDTDPVKDRLGGLCGLQAQGYQANKKEEEKERNKVVPTKPSLSNEPLKYNPILLQGKLKKEEDNNKNRGDKCNNLSGEKNISSYAANHLLEEVNYRHVNKGKVEEPTVESKDERSPLPSPPMQPQPMMRSSRGRSNQIPLQDLILIYDERKRRLANEREQRLNIARGQMNYQPSGVTPFRGRKETSEERLIDCLPKKNFSPLGPSRPIDKNLKAPLAEEIKVGDKVVSIASAVNAHREADGLVGLKQQHICEKEKSTNTNTNTNDENYDDKAKKPTGVSKDLVLVLKEMTNHFESVRSSLLRTDENHEAVAASNTSRGNSISAASPSAVGEAAVDSFSLEALRQDEGNVGEEFADFMGTTLDVDDLKRKTATPSGLNVEIDDSVDDEPVPLFLARNDTVHPPSGGSHFSVQVGGLNDVCRRSSKKYDGQLFPDDHKVEQGALSSHSVTGLNTDMIQMTTNKSEGPVFEGGCLCGSVFFRGLASNIFGSFVCNCVVCARFSGAMMGVEWLHLPDVPFEALFTDTPQSSPPPPPMQQETVKPSHETPAGAGVVAAQILTKVPSSHIVKCDAPVAEVVSLNTEDAKEEVNGKNDIVRLPPYLKKFTVDVPVVDEDDTQRTGIYTVYFCNRCGSTIGMDHDDIPGGLVAKAVLSDVSLAILESFQQTMPQCTNDGLFPGKK